mmetsp:Transcript_7193/g.16256  ORF Transcript_7193/g.16256 Transcript_7193/m.16256 type:complete len:149 (-) Transcript_7193:331-777(-)
MTATTVWNDELPRKVFQDDFRPGRGNALQAAVASIFGLELSDVPYFVELPEGYESAIRSFSHDRNRSCIKIRLDDGVQLDEKYGGRLCLLRGKSSRGDFGHVVVARRDNDKSLVVGEFQMMHDPHPDETFLDESEQFGWCMFFVPSCE